VERSIGLEGHEIAGKMGWKDRVRYVERMKTKDRAIDKEQQGEYLTPIIFICKVFKLTFEIKLSSHFTSSFSIKSNRYLSFLGCSFRLIDWPWPKVSVQGRSGSGLRRSR
jgi:hypothetical protein